MESMPIYNESGNNPHDTGICVQTRNCDINANIMKSEVEEIGPFMHEH